MIIKKLDLFVRLSFFFLIAFISNRENVHAISFNDANVLFSGNLITSRGSVSYGDIDNDGKLDAVGEGPEKYVKVIRSLDGVLSDETQSHIPEDLYNFYGTALADFDGDGDLDFATAGPHNTNSIYYWDSVTNNRYEKLGRVSELGGPNTYGRCVIAGDFTNDNKPDLVYGTTTGIYVAINNTTETDSAIRFSSIAAYAGASYTPIQAGNPSCAKGDFDNDGNLDFIFTDYVDGGAYFIGWGDGTGGFTEERAPNVSDTLKGMAVTTGDVNNDGKDDFLLHRGDTSNSDGKIILYSRNDENDGFDVATIRETTDDYYKTVYIGDINGDSHNDIVFSKTWNGVFIEMFLGDGTRTFSSSPDYSRTIGSSYQFYFYDIDGNGVLDLLTNYSQDIRYYTQNISFDGGDGTSEDPYQISTCRQLQHMNADLDAYYILNNDVDCSGTTTWNEGAGFEPIGTNYTIAATSFTGEFDGQGHTIDSLFINRPSTDDVGLFGAISNDAKIKNLGVTNVNITGAKGVGGLVGRGGYPDDSIHAIEVNNCYTTGVVKSNASNSSNYNWDIGGLIGYLSQSGNTVNKCYSTANVTTATYVNNIGGLIGYTNDISVADSYATGTISGNSRIGGLIGQALETEVRQSYATGTTNGYKYVGGFIGYSNKSNVSESYATGNATATNYNGGGFIGKIHGSTISNCYSTGNITKGGENDWESYGGFVGRIIIDNPVIPTTIENSYSTGMVMYPMGPINPFNRGFLGSPVDAADHIFTNNFFDTETSSQSSDEMGGATGKTTTEMQTQSTFTDAGWNFTSIWTGGNTDYPTLRAFGDIDEDGELDGTDPLLFTETEVSKEGVGSLSIKAGGVAPNSFKELSQQRVVFSDGADELIAFDFDFTSDTLDLSKTSLKKGDGYLIVDLDGQLQSGKTKTLKMQNNDYNTLCVKNAPVTAISQVSDSCAGANEYDFSTCLSAGSYSTNGISCTLTGDVIAVAGLDYSAMRGSTVSSGGGGGSRCSNKPQFIAFNPPKEVEQLESLSFLVAPTRSSLSWNDPEYVKQQILITLNDQTIAPEDIHVTRTKKMFESEVVVDTTQYIGDAEEAIFSIFMKGTPNHRSSCHITQAFSVKITGENSEPHASAPVEPTVKTKTEPEEVEYTPQVPDIVSSPAIPFWDTIDHWAKNSIRALRLRGVVQGKSPGIYAPDEGLTRNELTKIALLAFAYPLEENAALSSHFPDVSKSSWAHPYVLTAQKQDIVHGYGDGMFKGDRKISRAEALKIILRMSKLDLSVADPNPTPDIVDNAWYEPYALFAIEHDLIALNDYGLFAPESAITRAEIAEIIVKTWQQLLLEE